jgi:hypothetical protein
MPAGPPPAMQQRAEILSFATLWSYASGIPLAMECPAVTHFAPRSFTSFRMTTALYVILSVSEESLLPSRINRDGSK